jgi:hypothetical protein
MPRIATQNHFTFVRSPILNQPTAIEHQIASRIAKTLDSLTDENIADPLVRTHIKNN